MRKPDIHRLLELHQLLTSFAEIERVVHIKRRGEVLLESDTEHSYNLAITAWYLAAYFPELQIDRVIRLALVHDLVEIHAGDTFIFADKEMLDSKSAREAASQQQLAKDWKDFPALHETIHEYETRETPEACFVYALDKLMPMMTVYLNDGITWREKEMTLDNMNTQKAQKMRAFPAVLKYWEELHAMLLKFPELFPK